MTYETRKHNLTVETVTYKRFKVAWQSGRDHFRSLALEYTELDLGHVLEDVAQLFNRDGNHRACKLLQGYATLA